MWKKGEAGEVETGQPRQAQPRPARPSGPPAVTKSHETATIGPSITVKGDVTGEENLVIQGRVEGTVDLKGNRVTVGADGRVKADVSGHTVTVEGEVEGDIRGGEQVILRPSARVRGNIVAPRVILEDGAHFRGTIDMGEENHAAPGETEPPRQQAGTPEAPSSVGDLVQQIDSTSKADET